VTPLINILIRNKHRPQEFERCIESVNKQTYTNVMVWVCCDSLEAYKQAYQHYPGTSYCISPVNSVSHPWNLYCNNLMTLVWDGYLLLLDNDDYLIDSQALTRIVPYLTGDGVICQFLRNGRPKPSDRLIRERRIERGRIGGGSLILHSKHKDIAQWDGEKGADYRWIKAVSEKVSLEFVPIVVQVAGNNGGHGR
jgi:glycosyltransferase involved in cell wall biosynthesis